MVVSWIEYYYVVRVHYFVEEIFQYLGYFSLWYMSELDVDIKCLRLLHVSCVIIITKFSRTSFIIEFVRTIVHLSSLSLIITIIITNSTTIVASMVSVGLIQLLVSITIAFVSMVSVSTIHCLFTIFLLVVSFLFERLLEFLGGIYGLFYIGIKESGWDVQHWRIVFSFAQILCCYRHG